MLSTVGADVEIVSVVRVVSVRGLIKFPFMFLISFGFKLTSPLNLGEIPAESKAKVGVGGVVVGGGGGVCGRDCGWRRRRW